MLSFDEINVLQSQRNQRSIPIDRYIDEMDLPQSSKRDRKEFAHEMEHILFNTLSFIYILMTYKMLTNADSIASAVQTLENDVTALLRRYTYPDEYQTGYIHRYAVNFVDVTIKHVQEYDYTVDVESLSEDASYWLSRDRATFNAENEVNSIFNHEDFRQAKLDGYTQKRWVTMRDERVRQTHTVIDGLTIPIDDYFPVGDALMLYPRMECDAPEEVINCRCVCVYF